MQRFALSAILALIFAASGSQGQTSRSAGFYDNRTDYSDAEPNIDRTGTDNVLASTKGRAGRVNPDFGFLTKVDKGLLKEFDKAWRVSAAGMNGFEGVVLIFRRADGSYRGISQGSTREYHKFTFSWRPNALAIVHTHPNSCDPKPSPHDERVAETYHVPIFTITIRGMYVYNPATRTTSKVVKDLDWLKLSKWQETDAKLKGCVAQGVESCY